VRPEPRKPIRQGLLALLLALASPAALADEDVGARLAAAWCQALSAHVMQAGRGDPSVLSMWGLARTPATPRPAQIVFAATDLEASAPGRDGYDAFGLLLGRLADDDARVQVFAVGTLARSEHRPSDIVDVRLVLLWPQKGQLACRSGPPDAAALALYRQHALRGGSLRFPGAHDRFKLVRCDSGPCAEEAASGARWLLY
jgi:hypothetical protein